MRAATFNERRAFLLALFDKPKMYHGSYIAEKVRFALHEFTSSDLLYSALDTDNQARYRLELALDDAEVPNAPRL
jgi:hypothetical protein